MYCTILKIEDCAYTAIECKTCKMWYKDKCDATNIVSTVIDNISDSLRTKYTYLICHATTTKNGHKILGHLVLLIN